MMGFGFGLIAMLIAYRHKPSRVLYDQVLALTDNDPSKVHEGFNGIFLIGLMHVAIGFFCAACTLKALKWGNPLLAARVAWDALAVFVVYPEPAHPLIHKVQTPWLRPLSMRLAVTALALGAAATLPFLRSDQVPDAKTEAKAAQSIPPVRSSEKQPFPVQERLPPKDVAAMDIFGSRQVEATNRYAVPSPAPVPPAPAKAKTDTDGWEKFGVAAMLIIILPPALLFLMVWFAGMTVLPAYFNYFECPASSSDGNTP